MKSGKSVVAIIGGMLVAHGATACSRKGSDYMYISFEESPSAEILSTAPVQLESMVGTPTIPVEYLIARKDYSLHVTIDPEAYEPNATIRVAGIDRTFRLLPRPLRATPPNRPRSCGSYGKLSPTGDQFEFLWVICDTSATAAEFVIAFDVVAENGTSFQENLAFVLKSEGYYWLQDDL